MGENKKYSEEELVMLLKAADQDSFTYLYDNYAGALNGIICRIIDDSRLSEDILQEVFLKIWNNIAQYDQTKGRLFTWMVQIARNLAIDTLRSKGYRNQQKISRDENSVINITDKSSGQDQFDTLGLRTQVANLKQDHRNIIELAYFAGYTQDEISKQTGIPLGTVKTRMRSAIIELRKMLENK